MRASYNGNTVISKSARGRRNEVVGPGASLHGPGASMTPCAWKLLEKDGTRRTHVLRRSDFSFGVLKGRLGGPNSGRHFQGQDRLHRPRTAVRGSVDRRADVFSVGVMLWEALAKRWLTANETAATIVHKRLHGTLPSVKEINPEIPSKLAAICGSATALAPDERYSTAAQLQEALEAYLDLFGLRADDRDIGTLVSGAFELERSQISEVIEQHIGRASEGNIRVGLPSPGAPSSSASPPGLGLASSSPSFTVDVTPGGLVAAGSF
jgi:serine/threonine protein kinase